MGTVAIDHDYIRRVYGAAPWVKIYMLDSVEFTGHLRPPCESDWGYLDWSMNHDSIICRKSAISPVRTEGYGSKGIDRLILRLKPQPPTRQPRMAVSETYVYGPNIPPIPEGWEDDGFCVIREDVHEAYLDLSGEVRNTKKYALVGMVRIALKRKPQPPAPLIGPDTELGACFRSDGVAGKPPRYYKVISNSLDGLAQRNYLVIEKLEYEGRGDYKYTHGWGIYPACLSDGYMNSQPYLSHISDLIFRDQVMHVVGGVERKP